MLTRRLFCIYLALGVSAMDAFGQCKPYQGDRGPELTYRSRGGTPAEKRCEGFTKLDMAALNMEVVAVTRGRPSYYYMPNEVISITAPVVTGTASLQCEGRARVSGSYYRLDMELAPGETKYVPVKDVMLAGEVKNDLLGVVLRKPDTKDAYVPVRVSSRLNKGSVAAPDSLFLKLLPRRVLRDMTVEVYDPSTQKVLYRNTVRGLLKKDVELTMGIPVAALGLRRDAERTVLVQFVSAAEEREQADKVDKEPVRLDRAITVIFPKE